MPGAGDPAASWPLQRCRSWRDSLGSMSETLGGGGSDVELSEHVCPYPLVDAPNYGGRVPVDTTPGPVPVYRALKHHLHPNATTESCQDHQEPTISQQQQL